jgi:hypothetical protein
MEKEPIFIVGVPRSGTTLLAALLAAHSKLSCGPETHFFRKLPISNLESLIDAVTWPEQAIEFICSITHNSFSESKKTHLIDKFQIDKKQVEEYLKGKPPSIANVLASVTESHMLAMKKSRWVEKTPDHIEYVHLIRKYFPRSPIIRIIRDPRDNALSLVKMPWGPATIPEALFYWKRLDDLSKDFFQEDPLSYTILYEDLLLSLKEQLEKLCNFIGEEFEEGMLDTSHTGKQLNSRNVPWKEMASKPVDPSKLSVWKRELTDSENRLAEAILGDRLKVYGYPVAEDYDKLGVVFPRSSQIGKHKDVFQFLATQGIRFWKVHNQEYPTVRIYVGDPANSDWRGGTVPAKFKTTLSLFTELLQSVIKKDQVYWIPDNCEEQWTGFQSHLLKMLLTPHKIIISR